MKWRNRKDSDIIFHMFRYNCSHVLKTCPLLTIQYNSLAFASLVSVLIVASLWSGSLGSARTDRVVRCLSLSARTTLKWTCTPSLPSCRYPLLSLGSPERLSPLQISSHCDNLLIFIYTFFKLYSFCIKIVGTYKKKCQLF